MWQTKTFKIKEAMQRWIDKNDSRMQWEQIFVNNGFGVTYRKLRFVY